MGKLIKWFFVFFILFIWTINLNKDKLEMVMRPFVPSVSAEKYKVLLYDVKENKFINERDMERILFWTDWVVSGEIIVDKSGTYTDYRIIGINRTLDRKNLRVDVCTAGRRLRENPEIIEALPSMSRYAIKCRSGGVIGSYIIS